MHYIRLQEVCRRLQVESRLVDLLVEEDLIEVKRTLDNDEVLSPADAERLRVSHVLMRDLEVNLAGVAVILHMREDLLAAQHQFDSILHELVAELRQRLPR